MKKKREIPISKAAQMVDQWRAASSKETQAMLDFGVLRVVHRDEVPHGATVITRRLVVTHKVTNKDPVGFLTARLVARGFEQEYSTLQESVTADRRTARLLCHISVQKNWNI